MVEIQKFCWWHGPRYRKWKFFFILLLLYIYIIFFLQILLYYFYIFILCIIDNFVSSVCYWKSEYEGKVIYRDSFIYKSRKGGRRKGARFISSVTTQIPI